MSILIDNLLKKENTFSSFKRVDSMFYMAKPIPFYSYKTVLNRIKDGFRVMTGRSFAVHYKEDEQI